MNNQVCYLPPQPPRVWSRVQSQCTYSGNSTNNKMVYVPLTNQEITSAQAILQDKMLYKGNILQYKNNSSQWTKKQKYSYLANKLRNVSATQSQTYSNPNTRGLKRVNATVYPFPNELVGAPNNISGPFQYAVPNPFGCASLAIQDGGALLCNQYENPCNPSQQTKKTYTQTCFANSCSNVPGRGVLCWDPKVQTFFPRGTYRMNNSGNKWPYNYKWLNNKKQ